MVYQLYAIDGGILSVDVEAEMSQLPTDIRARFERIVHLIQAHGLESVRQPYVKHLEGPVWEMRMKGKGGIARAAYVTATGRRIVVVHVFQKKTQKTPRREIEISLKKGQGGSMRDKLVKVETSFAEWRKDPEYVAAYDSLEDEFSLADSLIRARAP